MMGSSLLFLKVFFSLSGSEADRVPITILRATSEKHSIARRGVLLFSDDSYCGTDLLVLGVKMSVLCILLHTVNLSSSLVSGPVHVGVRDRLPRELISFLVMT